MTHQYWEDAVKKGTPLHELVQFDGVHPTEEGYIYHVISITELFTLNGKQSSIADCMGNQFKKFSV
jgi:hypothetical protein